MMRCKPQQAAHYGPHQPGAPFWSATTKPCTILVRGFFMPARVARCARSALFGVEAWGVVNAVAPAALRCGSAALYALPAQRAR